MRYKKYQIFVSSTYEDLKKERNFAIQAILEMGHFPVGMEMFSAADEEQWKIIKNKIDECDYYVVIVAHRYGSLDGDVSYTEKEYDYAIKANVPVLGFIIEDSASWNPTFVDRDIGSIKEFKEKVKRKPISFWSNSKDLYGKISIALGKQFNSTPRTGWIRPPEIAGPDITEEISRLSKENAILRDQLEDSEAQIEKELTEEYDSIIDILKKNKVDMSFYYVGNSKWSDTIQISLYQIFWNLAPEIMIESPTTRIALVLAVVFHDQKKEVRSLWPIPSNRLNSWLADFVALHLVKPSSVKHSLKDKNDYWEISSKGKEFYNYLRRLRLEKAKVKEDLPESNNPEDDDNSQL